jgi:hypothetical protein
MSHTCQVISSRVQDKHFFAAKGNIVSQLWLTVFFTWALNLRISIWIHST